MTMAGFSKSLMAFDDVRAVLDRAAESSKGVKVVCKSRGEAVITRSRMNYLRVLDRKQNGIVYESDHPLHMRSVWDRLIIRIPPRGSPEETTIYVEKRSIDNWTIEEITDP